MKIDKAAQDAQNDVFYAASIQAPAYVEKQSMAEIKVPPPPVKPSGPPTVLATTDEEAKQHEQEVLNTKLWANAKDEKPIQMHQDVGEIEVNHL